MFSANKNIVYLLKGNGIENRGMTQGDLETSRDIYNIRRGIQKPASVRQGYASNLQ